MNSITVSWACADSSSQGNAAAMLSQKHTSRQRLSEPSFAAYKHKLAR